MADERVNITIDIDVKDLKSILATSGALKSLDSAANKTTSRLNKLSGAMGASNIQMTKGKNGAMQFSKQLSLLEKVGGQFVKRARMIMFTTIAMVAEFGISALTLASVNGLFVVGKVAMQAYNVGMQALAGTVAAFGVAAIAAAAAFKEFQAAQYQYRYKDSKEVGSALDQSGYALRSLYKDATLASFGVQGLSAAFGAVSKQSAFTPATKAALKAMADFAQASGDPQKSLTAAANFVGLMQKNKKFTAETLEAAKQISPEFEKAFKKGGYKNVKDFMDDLTSGKLATEAGVLGQANAVNQTLFAQFKQYIAIGLTELSDVGQRVLEPVKEALHDIFQGLLRTFRRVSNDLVSFGQGPFLQSLVGFTEKIEDFTVHLFRKFLPATEGFWRRIGRVFEGIGVYFFEVRDALDKLRDGGSIVIRTFGEPILEVFRQIGKSAGDIGDLAKNNRANWEKFSEAMVKFVQGFFDLSKGFKTAFDAALPIISLMISFVGKLMSLVGGLLKLAGSLPGVLGTAGGALGALGAGALAFKGRRAARYGRKGRGGGMSLEDAIYSGGSFSRMGGGGGGDDYRSLSGRMGAAVSSAMTPAANNLNTAGANLNNAAAALTGAAGRVGAPRGGMTSKGGSVNPDGTIRTLPTRRPGQSQADYRASLVRFAVPQNRMVERERLPLEARGYRTPTAGGPLTDAQMRQRYPQGMQNIFGRAIPPQSPLLPLRQMTKEEYKKLDSLRRQQQNNSPTGPPSRNARYERDAALQRANILPRRQGMFGRMGGFFKTVYNGPGTSLGGGPAGVAGQMGGGGGATGGGLRGTFGRLAFGDRYIPGEKIGAVKRTQQFLGMGRESKFGLAYNDAKMNALASGQKFSKLRGVGAGLKGSISGGGIVAGLLASQAVSSLQSRGIVSEEAGGALQLGSSLMAINPMLGIAAGGLGTAMSAKTKMGGTLSGAAGGAAIGSMILPGIGTAVGAILGGIGGFIKASFNQSGEARKGVKRIGEQFMVQVANAALAGINTGSTTGARMQVERFQQLSKNFTALNSQADRKKMLEPYKNILGKNQYDLMTGDKTGAAEEQFAKTAANMKAALTPAFNQFDDVMRSLMLSTGKTGDEIMELALKKNVNLYDSTLKLSDITAKLGVGMAKTAEQFGQALRDVQVASMSVFSEFKRSKEMTDALQAAGETLRGGDTSVDAFADYLQKQADFLSYKNPDSPLLNIVTQLRGFGTGANVGGGALFQPGGPLAGVNMNTETQGLIRSMGDKQITGAAFEAASQLGSMMTGAGFQFQNADLGRRNLEIQLQTLLKRASAGDRTAIEQVGLLEEDLKRGTALKGKSADEIATYLSTRLGGGSVLTGEDARRAGRGNAPGFMGTSIIGEVAGSYEQFSKALNEEAQALRQGFLDAIEDGFFKAQGIPDWWNTPPTWWANGLKIEDNKIVPADTRTPRRGQVGDTSVSKTLGRTMSRHNYFDGQLTGKRTITSSLRNWNLGSPSSDHATGNAYDLTGQNLGQYASLIKAAGGFAEFHGAASSRHLHVVPPAAPTGDTSTAKVAMAANGTGGQTVSSDNITINVYETNNPKATAEEVAKKLIQMQRNVRQRS